MNHNELKSQTLLIRMQILKLFIKTEKDFIKIPHRLFTNEHGQYIIHVTFINATTIYFETFYKDANNVAFNITKHKVESKQSNSIMDAVMATLSPEEIITSDSHMCCRATNPKVIKKPDVEIDDNIRKSRRRIQVTAPVLQETIDESHLIKVVTSKQRKDALLERQIFNDPKMWKWKL